MEQPVVSIDPAKGFDIGPEESRVFAAMVQPIGQQLGLPGLGCMHVTVKPGRRAFPFHNHLGNDEMFVILEGSGTYRYGDQEFPVAAGDVCGAPRGGPDTAHQLINDSGAPLKYLAVSTKNDPEVVEYPDSGKFAAIAVSPGPSFMKAHLRFVGRTKDSLDYYDGEGV